MGKIAVAVAWAVAIANDSAHGYTQDMDGRWGPDYDCATLIYSAWEQAGVPVKSSNSSPWYTGTMYNHFTSQGFTDVTSQITLSTGAGLQAGDVLLNTSNHVEMYIGDGQNVAARINENGETTGGETGDQTGQEITVRSYYNYPWNYVLRYTAEDSTGEITDYPGYVWWYFKQRINNEMGVAGLMGNLQSESGIIPYRKQGDFTSGYTTSLQYTEDVNTGAKSKDTFVHDSVGYGLAQWTYYTRKQALYEMWQSGSYDSIGDIKLACDYLWYELQNDFPGVLSVLKNCTDIRTASDKVLHDFENPEVQDEAEEVERYNQAVAWYEKYKGTDDNPGTDDPYEPIPEKKKGLSLLMMYLATRGY